MKRKNKKEMTIAEKLVLIAIAISTITFLLRMWDPAFFHWFHMRPMQEVSFLRNIWQTVWLTFQIIIYLVWITSVLWLLIFLVAFVIAMAIEIVAVIFDIIFAIYNLLTWIIPFQRMKISIIEICSEFLEDILYKVSEFELLGNKVENITPVMIGIAFVSSMFFVIPLTVTLF